MRFSIAHTADWHFSAATLDKGLAFCDFFFNYCRERQVAAIMHAGDIYNSSVMVGDGTFNKLIQALRKAPAPMYIIEGTKQHDRPGSIDVFDNIMTDDMHNIHTFREPGSLRLYLVDDYLITFPAPDTEAIAAWLSVLPTPTRAWLAAQYDLSLKELGDKLQEYMSDIFAGFGAKAESTPHILLSHIEVAGSECSTGQVMGSGDIRVGVADILKAKATLTMLGHIHKAQQPSLEAHNIFYSGSPYPLNLGEMEPKGFRIYTFEDGLLVNNEFIPTPLSIARPIQVIKIELQDDQFIWDAEPIPDVDLKVKVYAPRDWLTDEAMADIEKRCVIANSFKIDKFPQPENRIRAAKLPYMHNLHDEFNEWGAVKNVKITDTAIAKLELIEKEVPV